MPYGAANPYYRSAEWRSLRQATLDRDDNRCQACGRRADAGMHVHHVYGLSVDPTGEHLASLDKPCHETVEKLVMRKSRLRPEMVRQLLLLAWRKIYGPEADVEIELTLRVNGEIVNG